MLDDPAVRRKIVQEQAAAKLEGKERAAIVSASPFGRGYLPLVPTFSSLCQVVAGIPTPQAGDVIEGHIHYHLHQDTTVTCQFLDDLGNVRTGSIRVRQGGGGDDWRSMTGLSRDSDFNTHGPDGGPIPFYVVGPERVFKLRPGQRRGDELDPGNNWPWNSSACRWEDNFQ
jgi:hypothetical protein